MKRTMHLVGYLMAGPTWHNNGSWRHRDSDAICALDPSRYEHLAQVMERACFDALFFVDFLGINDTFEGRFDAVARWAGQMSMMDPMQLLAAIARQTKHIGLAATMSTAGYHPFHIARSFATLDHISGGRTAWNVVTSSVLMEARNLGLGSLPSKDARYDRADEVVEACCRLWESWQSDALVLDRQSGIYADPAKISYANYEGHYVSTRGPLPTPRSPQGRPVIMQAGSSPRGRNFAGRWAEVIFTHQGKPEAMQAFYRDIKRRVVRSGRNPDQCCILPALDVIAGRTRAEAEDMAADLDGLVSAELGVAEMSIILGQDLSKYPLDEPMPSQQTPAAVQGVADNLQAGGALDELTLREAGRLYGVNQMTPRLVGDAIMIADRMQEWFDGKCCDGFMVVPADSPRGYENFCALVVPELQKRGLFRRNYAGQTLRANLFER